MSKQPLVLLPGFLCDASVWEYQVEHLKSMTDITIPDLSKVNTAKGMVDAVIEEAPYKFALAGHSMGGWVALEVMRHFPERVTRLCLLNTTANQDSPDKAAIRKEFISMAEQGKYQEIISRIANAFVYRKEYESKVRKMLEKNKHALVSQETAMLTRPDTFPVLATIKCPALVVYSYNDAIFNINDAESLVESIPKANLAIVNNCGHMSPMEAAEEVCQLMRDWLA